MFEVIRPSVLCGPVAIIANESFPIGFVMAPTGGRDLCQLSADFVRQFGIPGFTEKQILSDEGVALHAYASGITATHFPCYRQILEGFGSRSSVTRIVHALSYSATKEEYERRALRAQLLIDHLKRIGRVTEIAVRKACDLSGEDASTSVDRLQLQGLWTRSHFGAMTCSNHLERLPRDLRAPVGGPGSFSSRVTTMSKTWKNAL
jgi:hypothetical protein